MRRCHRRKPSLIRTTTDAIGRGLVAGLAGTAAMTISSTIEMKLSGRGASNAPADAAEKVLGVVATDDGKQRFGTIVHWSYGTSWGVVRGMLDTVGLHGPTATAVHLATVWGAEQAVLPTLDVSRPVWDYGLTATGTDLLHHGVYAIATGLTYDWLRRA